MTRTPFRDSLLALMLTTASASAFAHGTMPRVDARQDHQSQRIGQGVASGELTAREAVRLEHGQRRVEHAEQRALADGVVTRREQFRLHDLQQAESRRIYVQKHDRQRAY
jgi:hypothetical protein